MSGWGNIRGLWPGALALLSSLAGTLLIRSEGTRLLGVLWLLAGAGLAVLAWRDQQWEPAFRVSGVGYQVSELGRRRLLAIVGIVLAAIFVLAANLAYVGSPGEAFGLAGWLWLGGIILLLASTYAWDRASAKETEDQPKGSQRWVRWEIGTFAGLVLLSFVLRVWDLSSFPYNIYPDEIMTGQVANGAYLSAQPPPPLFSTLWGGIDLPALWFFIVSRFQIAGGSTLEMLRLPGALFGAATVVPFYLMVRGVWGRWAAIGGATILAAGASNINYSRLALNNIVAPFFWTICFFFLLRAIRERRALYWALAGLSAGLSEHFYNGTRLLPLILACFFAYLLLFHWRQARGLIGAYALAALGFLAGFGPLLAHFLRNPNLYFERGTELLTWKEGMPTNLDALGRMWGTLSPIVGDNLLGFSTNPSQDIMYFAPLLLVPEAALLVLGFALMVWKWKHPAAFLMLVSGLGVLFVGGTLVSYPNASFPQLNHWTPAFPAIYAGIAVAMGAFATSIEARQPSTRRWVVPATMGAAIALLAIWNVIYYFGVYKADASVLKSDNYRQAQEYYEVQNAQSRYVASLDNGYRAVWVGPSTRPYDAGVTYALAGREPDAVRLANPESELANLVAGTSSLERRGLAFIIFLEHEQYRPLVEARFPGGKAGTVYGPTGKPLFATYEVQP